MYAIPADAKHPDNAHAFINFMMQPEVAAANSNFVNYANGNAASLAARNEDVRNDPGIYPPPEVKAKLFPDLAETDEFTRLLNRTLDPLHDGQVTARWASRRREPAAVGTASGRAVSFATCAGSDYCTKRLREPEPHSRQRRSLMATSPAPTQHKFEPWNDPQAKPLRPDRAGHQEVRRLRRGRRRLAGHLPEGDLLPARRLRAAARRRCCACWPASSGRPPARSSSTAST